MNRAEFVRKKYRLDALTYIEQKVDGKALGLGPVMAPDCFQKFVDGDPSGNGKYLDWMLYMAAGGHDNAMKVQILWDGEGPEDEHALRNISRGEYIDDAMTGYLDKLSNKRVAPVSREAAEAAWPAVMEEIKREFQLGDQDFACEDGFGYFRHWPGRDNHYANVVAYVRNWDAAVPKFRAQNAAIAERMAKIAVGTVVDAPKAAYPGPTDNVLENTVVELDLYKGWKPDSLLQPDAAYNTLAKLTTVLNGRTRDAVLADTRHVVVCDNEHLTAVCPLTIGASVKYGHHRWCTANKSDFDRTMATGGNTTGNWGQFSSKGPLVYVQFKQAMPFYIYRLAVHITPENGDMTKLRTQGTRGHTEWYDLRNARNTVTPESILSAIRSGHEPCAVLRPEKDAANEQDDMDAGVLKYLGWARGQQSAWSTEAQSEAVAASFTQFLGAMDKWVRKFDHSLVESVTKIPDITQLP